MYNNLGHYGEYRIYKSLQSYESKGYRFLFNLYIPKNKNETTELDVLMIGPQGFFVFESKNYSGWIFGDDRNEIWCQTLPHYSGGSFKTRFYNPVKQNFNHICALKNLCHSDIPCYSIVVFSDRCEIKKLTLSHPRSFVIHHYELTDCIENIVQLNSQYLTPSKLTIFIIPCTFVHKFQLL